MIRRTLTYFLATVVISGVAAPATAVENKDHTRDYAPITEDIEIMQRVVQTALEKHFAGNGAIAAGSVLGAIPQLDLLLGRLGKKSDKAASATRLYELAQLQSLPLLETYGTASIDLSSLLDFDLEGFYVPGTGVIYTLTFPTGVKETSPDEEPETNEDLWLQIENEVRGKTSRVSWNVEAGSPTKQYTMDEESLNDTVQVLIKTIGEYGSRLEQLQDHESIILAARANALLPGGTVPHLRKPLLGTFLGIPTPLLYGGRSLTSYRVIIQVPASAIRGFASGEIDLTSLAEHTTVTKYKCSSPDSNASPRRLQLLRRK